MQKDFSASYTHDPPLSILSPLISRSIRTPISHSLYPISDFREGPIKFLATDPQFATRRSLDKGIKREFSFGQIDLISSIQSKVTRKIMKQTMNANSVAIEFMNKVLTNHIF